jgi:hypothetical protein
VVNPRKDRGGNDKSRRHHGAGVLQDTAAATTTFCRFYVFCFHVFILKI